MVADFLFSDGSGNTISCLVVPLLRLEWDVMGTSWGLAALVSVFFCPDKIQGDQDRAFLFRGGLTNNKAHYDLSWFRPLLGGNSPTSIGLILKMNIG
jgi:hypothetical protein